MCWKQIGSVFPSQLSGKKINKWQNGTSEASKQLLVNAAMRKNNKLQIIVCSAARRGDAGERRLFSAWLVSNGPVKKLDCFPLPHPENGGCTSTCVIIETLN